MGRYTIDLGDIFEILLYIEMIINDKFYFIKKLYFINGVVLQESEQEKDLGVRGCHTQFPYSNKIKF